MAILVYAMEGRNLIMYFHEGVGTTGRIGWRWGMRTSGRVGWRRRYEDSWQYSGIMSTMLGGQWAKHHTVEWLTEAISTYNIAHDSAILERNDEKYTWVIIHTCMSAWLLYEHCVKLYKVHTCYICMIKLNINGELIHDMYAIVHILYNYGEYTWDIMHTCEIWDNEFT